MLGRLLKRQIQSSMVYTSSGYVDSLGRVGRFFEGNWAGAYVDQNTALGIPAIYRGITLISDAIVRFHFVHIAINAKYYQRHKF